MRRVQFSAAQIDGYREPAGISDKSAESRSKAIGGLVNRALLLSPSKISLWVRGRSRSASGVNTGTHAFTHLRVRSYESRAICNAWCIRTRLRFAPRPPADYARAFTSPDMRTRDCPKLVEILSSLAHADRMRLGTLGGEAANWTSAVSFARACRKILIFSTVTSFRNICEMQLLKFLLCISLWDCQRKVIAKVITLLMPSLRYRFICPICFVAAVKLL